MLQTTPTFLKESWTKNFIAKTSFLLFSLGFLKFFVFLIAYNLCSIKSLVLIPLNKVKVLSLPFFLFFVFLIAYNLCSIKSLVLIPLNKVKVLSLPFFLFFVFLIAYNLCSIKSLVLIPLNKVKVLSLPFFQERKSFLCLCFIRGNHDHRLQKILMQTMVYFIGGCHKIYVSRFCFQSK